MPNLCSYAAGMLGMSLASSIFICDRTTPQFFPTTDEIAVSSNTLVRKVDLRNEAALLRNLTKLSCSSNQSSRRWSLRSTAQTGDIKLSDDDRKSWEKCKGALSELGFNSEEQDKMLGKAFGHIHSPYWNEERKVEIPKHETMSEILDYLRSLALSDDDLRKVLKKFPEVLGCSLEDELKNNVMALEKNWRITGKSLKNLLLRNPKVLGFNVDCKGDCVAQCTRCWARF